MLRVAQVATRLNCSVSTVYSLIESGRLAHYRCPGVRVSEEQLNAYLRTVEKGHEPPAPKVRRPPRPNLRHISLK